MRHPRSELTISLLWVTVAVLTLMHMILEVAAPGAIDELRTGSLHGMDTSGLATVVWVAFALVPMLMACVPLTLPDVPARWTSGVVGVICTALWTPLPGTEEVMTPGAVTVTVAVMAAGLAIAALAWKVPFDRTTDEQQHRLAAHV